MNVPENALVPNLQIGNALVFETLFREPLPENCAFENHLTPLAVFACHGLRIGDSKTPAFPIRDWERALNGAHGGRLTLLRDSVLECVRSIRIAKLAQQIQQQPPFFIPFSLAFAILTPACTYLSVRLSFHALASS